MQLLSYLYQAIEPLLLAFSVLMALWFKRQENIAKKQAEQSDLIASQSQIIQTETEELIDQSKNVVDEQRRLDRTPVDRADIHRWLSEQANGRHPDSLP